jgi:hypothetical protein
VTRRDGKSERTEDLGDRTSSFGFGNSPAKSRREPMGGAVIAGAVGDCVIAGQAFAFEVFNEKPRAEPWDGKPWIENRAYWRRIGSAQAEVDAAIAAERARTGNHTHAVTGSRWPARIKRLADELDDLWLEDALETSRAGCYLADDADTTRRAT